MLFPATSILVSITTLLLLLVAGAPLDADSTSSCTYEQRRAACAAEITTIGSHTVADAAAIPLAPLASRTFYITPTELGGGVTLPPVNVGVTADTVRLELVALATFLDAGVPPDSVQYIDNANGTMTVDFIQTDRIALPRVNVREIHDFNDACEITKIVGYVHGSLVCPAPAGNAVITALCDELAAEGA